MVPTSTLHMQFNAAAVLLAATGGARRPGHYEYLGTCYRWTEKFSGMHTSVG